MLVDIRILKNICIYSFGSGLSCSNTGSFIVACELSSLTRDQIVLPALRGRVLTAGLSRKFLEFSIRLLLYICLCPAPKGSEPQCCASHTLCGVFNAGGPCRGREVGRVRKDWGGNAAAEWQWCLSSWAVLAYSLRHRQQEVSGWMWRGLSTSDEPNTESRMVPSQPGVSKETEGADISIWPSSGVRGEAGSWTQALCMWHRKTASGGRAHMAPFVSRDKAISHLLAEPQLSCHPCCQLALCQACLSSVLYPLPEVVLVRTKRGGA